MEEKPTARKPRAKKGDSPAPPAELTLEHVLSALQSLGLKFPLPASVEPEPEVPESEPEVIEPEVPEPEVPEPEVPEPEVPEPEVPEPEVPAMVDLSIPNFLSLFMVGRLNAPGTPSHGQVFTKAAGEIDLIRLAGLLDYAVKFKDEKWRELMGLNKG